MHVTGYALLAASSFAAGAINSVAGGGTVLTFPALLAVGVAPVAANATSTLAVVTGSLTSAYGYRDEIGRSRRLMGWMIIPSVIGGGIGAMLVLHVGDASFRKLVPWLILTATALFLTQEPISRWLKATQEKELRETAEGHGHDPDNPQGGRLAAVLEYQLLVAVYGGFFGAGIGILQLAALGFLGLTNIHRMNAVKNVTSSAINVVASIAFILGGRVVWPLALLMAVCAIAGGYGGAGVARKIGQARVRQIIIGVGFSIAALMFYRQFHGGM